MNREWMARLDHRASMGVMGVWVLQVHQDPLEEKAYLVTRVSPDKTA